MAQNQTPVTATLTAENTFSNAFTLYYTSDGLMTEKVHNGWADLSISGVSDSTVTVQRRSSGTGTWKDVQDYTSNQERCIEDKVFGVQFRVGIKTGNYGSDTVVIEITG